MNNQTSKFVLSELFCLCGEQFYAVLSFVVLSGPKKNIPESVGEDDERQCDDVVHHHDSRVLPPCVHVDCSIDGVAVEAALDQVGYGDV